MREIVYKNLTKTASKKRDVSIEEIVEKDGLVSSTTKRSMYFIRDAHRMKSKGELSTWLEERKKDTSLTKKFFHIYRKFSEETKEDKLVCKMRGSFYIISGQAVYNIVFVHILKVHMRRLEKKHA